MSAVPQGDLTPYLNKAADNAVFQLAGAYTLNNAILKANGVKLIGDTKNRAKITLLGTGCDVQGKGVEVAGLSFMSKIGGGGWRKVFEVDGGSFNCHDCDADRITNFAVINGDNSRFTKIVTGLNVGGDVYYNAACGSILTDIVVQGLSSPDSEHAYREDIGKTGRVPTNNQIIGGSWTNLSTDNKEAWALRKSVNFTGDGATIYGYIRGGQDAGDNHVTNMTLKNLTFATNLPAMTLIDMKFGVTGTIGKYTLGLPGHPFVQKQTELAVGPNSHINHVTA